MVEPKERGQVPKAAGAAVGAPDAVEEVADGQKAVGADQREDLPDGGQEGYGVNQAQEPEQNEARYPVLIG